MAAEEEKSDEAEHDEGQIYDHLHQVFITKNIVLCSEVSTILSYVVK